MVARGRPKGRACSVKQELTSLRSEVADLRRENGRFAGALFASGDPASIAPDGFLQRFAHLPRELIVRLWTLTAPCRLDSFRLVCHAWNDLLLAHSHLLPIHVLDELHMTSQDADDKVVLMALRRRGRESTVSCALCQLGSLLRRVRLQGDLLLRLSRVRGPALLRVLRDLPSRLLRPAKLVFEGDLTLVPVQLLIETIRALRRKNLHLHFQDVTLGDAPLPSSILHLPQLRSLDIHETRSSLSPLIADSSLLMLNTWELRTIRLHHCATISADGLRGFLEVHSAALPRFHLQQWRARAKMSKEPSTTPTRIAMHLHDCTQLRHCEDINAFAKLLKRRKVNAMDWKFMAGPHRLSIHIHSTVHDG